MSRNRRSRRPVACAISDTVAARRKFWASWFPSFTIFLVKFYHHPKGTTILFDGG